MTEVTPNLIQMNPYPDCEVCHKIWRQFADPENRPELNLGTFDEAVSSYCPTHTPLIQGFKDYYLQSEARIGLFGKGDDVGFRAGQPELDMRKHSPMLTQSVKNLGLCWNLLLLHQEKVPDHLGTGRILDPDWIDLDIVKKWKHECLSSHKKCENPMKIPRTRPAWLIDLETMSVVPGEDTGSFVALSYRWGDDTKFMTDYEMMLKLQRLGSLEDKEIADKLPPIMLHAMYLTRAIGERYLWTDSLCIIHGDVATGEQLNLMGSIYASATVTIIAADGDAQHGLPGLKGVSAPRNLEQKIFTFGKESIMVRNTRIFDMGSGTPYNERGWTYQEYKMASRKILFNKKEIHWECQCSVWHEELTLGTEVDKYIDPRMNDILAGFPDLGSYSHIVSRYNNCKLTYDEDANPGISGLLAIISRAFEGGFLYGLPEMMFDRGLGWDPQWGHTDLRRRKASERVLENPLPSSALPSWSWVGWQGLTTLGYGDASRINDISPRIEETFPITEWYTSTSPTGTPRRKIRSTWYENRANFKDLTKPLPPGWTSHELKVEDRIYPDRCGDRVFTHSNLQGDDGKPVYWYYPFPIADIQESTPLFTPEQTPYLFCQTKRAYVTAYPAKPKKPFISVSQNHLELSYEAGVEIGDLHLHNSEQRKGFPETATEETTGTKLELVAIYWTRQYAKTFSEELRKYTYPHTVKDRYKVLWVEWKDGVAYRLASGTVDKAAWEALDLEDVSLVLG